MADAFPPDAILSERLVLPLLTAARMERLVAGDVDSVEREIGLGLPSAWLADADRLIRFRLNQVREHPEDEPWLIRPIAVRTPPATAIGIFNFHGSPDERGFAEVGYGLDPTHRNQGYAIEAVRGVLDWAAHEHGVNRFRASIAPTNERSINLVTKLGMRRVGSQWDEDDGLELLYTIEQWGTG